MTKARKYYTLAIRENGKWHPMFGAYSRADVESERVSYRDYGFKARDTKILTTDDIQSAIDDGVAIHAALAKLNQESSK